MKKVGLVTYHCSGNNGAIMQMYALCRFLKEHGCDVHVIDIRHVEFDIHNISEGNNIVVRLIKSALLPKRMHRIWSYLPAITRHYLSMEDLRSDPPEYDYYVVGSDQVWNHKIARDRALAYFLDFGPDSVKRFSYASSFGLSNWEAGPYASTEQVQKCFNRFKKISVREIEGKKILAEIFHKDATLVLDPTLLYDNYSELTGKIRQRREIVCYKMNKTADFFAMMPEVKRRLGMPALFLNHNYPKKGFKYQFNPDTRTWLRKIAGAAFIVTDSFHGLAFSIIYRKQFVVILNHNGKDSRLITLCKVLHLEDRMFGSMEEMCKTDAWLAPVDYAKAEPYLLSMREQSENFILNALDE